jgi:hypothetical protein
MRNQRMEAKGNKLKERVSMRQWKQERQIPKRGKYRIKITK